MSKRWLAVFLALLALLAITLVTALGHFYALHEEFLSNNFDSIHGARTLLKAQFLLREAQKELETAANSKAPPNLVAAASLLSLAANYGAEGVDRDPAVRASLVAQVQALQARVASLLQQNLRGHEPPPAEIAEVARATRSISEAFGAAELERWGMLSSLNAELSLRMRQQKWLIGGAGVLFVLLLGLLVWSMVRQRQIAEQLREAKAATDTIQQSTLDAALSGILYLRFVGQGERTVFRVNKKVEEMFGYRGDELVGSNTALLYANAATYRDVGVAAYPILAAGETYRSEIQARRKDGSLFWCSIVGRAIDAKDPSMGAIWMLDDISKRRQAEMDLRAATQAAEDANAAKSRFLAAASHDLRQPMQAISLFAHALDRTQLNDQQKQLAHNLTGAANALGDLLTTLLDISKLDAGVVKPQMVPTDISDIFYRIENECAALALQKNLRFKLFFPHRPLTLFTDPKLLMGLLRNVIGNAIKYTEKGGVLVGMRLRGKSVVIEVWDTGIGISAQDMLHVYTEFFQVNNPQRSRAEGLGLGLSIVKRTAALLGCEINCRSKPGRGTVFGIGIPLDQAGVAARPEESVHPVTPGDDSSFLAGQRVIIIEDDPFVAQGLQTWFEMHGSIVSIFQNGSDALTCPFLLDANLYVSDYRLPGDMNGVEVLDAIQQRSLRPIHGLLITGDTSAKRIDEFAMAKWQVLHKPIEPTALLSSIAAMCVSGDG